MNVKELAEYLLGLPDQTLPVCRVTQYGEVEEITSFAVKPPFTGKSAIGVNRKKRVELE